LVIKITNLFNKRYKPTHKISTFILDAYCGLPYKNELIRIEVIAAIDLINK
jgi:hypothetical protein